MSLGIKKYNPLISSLMCFFLTDEHLMFNNTLMDLCWRKLHSALEWLQYDYLLLSLFSFLVCNKLHSTVCQTVFFLGSRLFNFLSVFLPFYFSEHRCFFSNSLLHTQADPHNEMCTKKICYNLKKKKKKQISFSSLFHQICLY